MAEPNAGAISAATKKIPATTHLLSFEESTFLRAGRIYPPPLGNTIATPSARTPNAPHFFVDLPRTRP
jgi:hypothetical protein